MWKYTQQISSFQSKSIKASTLNYEFRPLTSDAKNTILESTKQLTGTKYLYKIDFPNNIKLLENYIRNIK